MEDRRGDVDQAGTGHPVPEGAGARRSGRRRARIGLSLALAVLGLARVAFAAGIALTLVIAAVAGIAFAVVLGLLHRRADKADGDDCAALLPVWAAVTHGAPIRVKNPEAEVLGRLRFFPGAIEWTPNAGSRRMGAETIRWEIRVPEQVRVFDGDRLSSQKQLRVYDGAGQPEADLWIWATPSRVRHFLELTLPAASRRTTDAS